MKNFTIKFLSLVLCLWCLAPSGSLNAQDCTTATAITTTGCATTTTTDPGLTGTASNVCFGSGGTLANWYSYVAPADGLLTIASADNGGGNDTRLSVYSDCPTATCVDSDDDGGPGYFSLLEDVAITSGTTYYIEWDDRWGAGGFDFDVTFSCVTPADPTGVAGTVSNEIVVTYGADVTGLEIGPVGFTAGTGTVVPATGSPQTINSPGITDCGTIDVIALNDCLGDPACAAASGAATINTFCPCGDPTGITATDMTPCGGPASVDVAWTSGMAPDNYEVEFGAPGFTPGTGAETASATVTGAVMTTVTTGLAIGTDYEVYVRHDCGTGFSAWNGPVAVTTGGAAGGSCDCPNVITTTGCTPTTTTDPGLTGTASNVCFGSGATLANWYSYVAPADGVLTIESLAGGASGDTRLSLYDDCPVTNCVDSNDDFGGTFLSQIADAPVTSGTTYYIEWDDRWGSGGFDFDVTFNCVTPADPTGMAGTVSGDIIVTYAGDVTHLDIAGTLVPATGSPQTVSSPAITDCGTVDVMTVNDCLGDPACAATSAAVTINTFCPCGDPGSIAAVDASTCNTPQVDVTWTTGMAPDNYEVEIVAAGAGQGTGTVVTVTGGLMYSFTMADGIAVGTDYEVYVRHDCGTGFSAWNGPAAVSTGGAPGSGCDCPEVVTTTEDCVTSTFTAADASAGAAANVCGTGATNARWYEYTPAADGVITIESLAGGASTDTRVSLYSDCPAATCVGTNDDIGGGNFLTLLEDAPVTGGTTYYIEWDDRWSGGGFDWTLTWCLANDDCDGAININGGGAPGEPTGTAVSGTTVGASASTVTLDPASGTPACTGDADDDVWFEFTTDTDTNDPEEFTVTVTSISGNAPEIIIYEGLCAGLSYVACGTGSVTYASAGEGVTYFVQCYDPAAGFTGGGADERSADDFEIEVAGAALPAELISFKGKAMEKYNALAWETATEQNTAEFVIERSLDGRNNWEVIGREEAAGNSESVLAYSFDDMRPLSQGYYRLNTIDLDGSSEMSSIISIKREATGFDVVLVSPNPTNTITTVTFESLDDTRVNATLTDVTGKVVTTLTQDAISGMNNMTIDLSNTPSGIYFLNMNNGVDNVTRRIVKN